MGEKRNLWPPLPRMTQGLPHEQVISVACSKKANSVRYQISDRPPWLPPKRQKKEREDRVKGDSHPRKGWEGGSSSLLRLRETAEARSAQPSARR